MAESAHGESAGWKAWLTTTDHKKIGIMYFWAAFAFFLIGGIAALVVRTELFTPGLDFVSGSTYNEMFSLHGTLMIFLWIMPAMAALGNYFVPLMLEAPDMAFPRVNALSLWLIPPAGLLLILGLFVPGS
jgi:cytochrome c oxidase subunit 1